MLPKERRRRAVAGHGCGSSRRSADLRKVHLGRGRRTRPSPDQLHDSRSTELERHRAEVRLQDGENGEKHSHQVRPLTGRSRVRGRLRPPAACPRFWRRQRSDAGRAGALLRLSRLNPLSPCAPSAWSAPRSCMARSMNPDPPTRNSSGSPWSGNTGADRSRPRTVEGWAFFELDLRSTRKRAVRPEDARRFALRLLSVLMAHWDNKSENQRLVCLSQARTGLRAASCGASRSRCSTMSAGRSARARSISGAVGESVSIWVDRATLHGDDG